MFLLAQETVEEGITSNLDAADFVFLVGIILFAIAFVIRLTLRPIPIDGIIIAAGFVTLALGLFLL